MAAQPAVVLRQVEFVADIRPELVRMLVEQPRLRAALDVQFSRIRIGRRGVGQQGAGIAARRQAGVGVGEIGARYHRIGIANQSADADGAIVPPIPAVTVSQLDRETADALFDEGGIDSVVVARGCARTGEIGIRREQFAEIRIIHVALCQGSGSRQRVPMPRGLHAREVGPHVRADRGEPERLRAQLRRVEHLLDRSRANQCRRRIRPRQHIARQRCAGGEPARPAEIVRHATGDDLVPHHPLKSAANHRLLERRVGRRQRKALLLEKLEVAPALPILEHRIDPAGEFVGDQRHGDVEFRALLAPAAKRERGRSLAAVEQCGLGGGVQHPAGRADAVEHGVGPAVHIDALDVEDVRRQGPREIVPRHRRPGETANLGRRVVPLVVVAVVIEPEVVVAAHRIPEKILRPRRADVLQEFSRQHGDSRRRHEQARVHARARERIGGAITLIPGGGDQERRELHGRFFFGRGRGGLPQSRKREQGEDKDSNAQRARSGVHGVWDGETIWSSVTARRFPPRPWRPDAGVIPPSRRQHRSRQT